MSVDKPEGSQEDKFQTTQRPSQQDLAQAKVNPTFFVIPMHSMWIFHIRNVKSDKNSTSF